MRESDIEAALRGGVAMLGGIAYKFVSPGRVGVPDRIVVMPSGATVFVELKAPSKKPPSKKPPSKKPEPHQEREHERLRKLGHRVYVIDSLEGVKKLLEELGA